MIRNSQFIHLLLLFSISIIQTKHGCGFVQDTFFKDLTSNSVKNKNVHYEVLKNFIRLLKTITLKIVVL